MAERQWGAIGRKQLTALGLGVAQIDRLVATKRLVPLHRGVYRLAGAPPSCRQSLLAACLAGGPHAFASHRSSGALWDLARVRQIRPEILVPGVTAPSVRGVIVHRTDGWDAEDATAIDGIPCTALPRTVLDLGAVVPLPVVESAMEDAVVRLGTQFSALRDCLDRLAARGRNGCGVLRTLLDCRDPLLAAPQSELELELLRIMRRAGIREPERQIWLHRPGAAPVCVDIGWRDVRVGIEADSRVWHAGRLDVQRNSEKHNTLALLDWRILRYTWFDTRNRRSQIIEQVHRFLAS
ncbi:MAG: hypothetical protein QOG64_1088 [Acidimicrobiaceae bacterium]|nr:hypothetical protein [Acidimicrobiaceae bacterium]